MSTLVDRRTATDPAVLSDPDRPCLRAARFGPYPDVLIDQRPLTDMHVVERMLTGLRQGSRLREHRGHVIDSIVSSH